MHIILNNVSSLDQSSGEVQEITRSALDLKGILDDYAFMAQINPTTSIPNNPLVRVVLPHFVESVAFNAIRLNPIQRSLEFQFERAEDDVLIDKVYLERILTHLCTNAAKYSPDLSTIRVSVIGPQDREDALYTFQVTNTCSKDFNVVDIATSLDSSLVHFQRYINSKEANNQSGSLAYYHGLGFGLVVSATMVKCLGGILQCSYEASIVTFQFTINLGRQPMSTQTSYDSDEYVPYISPLSEQNSDELVQRIIKSRVSTASKSRRPVSTGRILVVDDSAVCRKLLVGKLNEAGYPTETAVNGYEACQCLKSSKDIDAIVLDLHMPIMDGIEATRVIRKEMNSQVPILVLSAEQGVYKKEALKQGANVCLEKPAVASDVIAQLRMLIANKPR